MQRKYKYGQDYDSSFQKPLTTEPMMDFKVLSVDILSCERQAPGAASALFRKLCFQGDQQVQPQAHRLGGSCVQQLSVPPVQAKGCAR